MLARNRKALTELSESDLRLEYLDLEAITVLAKLDLFDLLAVRGRMRAIERLLECTANA